MENGITDLEQWFDAAVQEMQPFDASVWLGYPASGRCAYTTPAQLNTALGRQAIQGALVSHTMSVFHDAGEGNCALGEALKELPDCYGIMTLLPEGTGEFMDLTHSVEDYLATRMRAARLFPKDQRYSLRVPGIPKLLDMLQSLGIPVFIPIGQTSWDEIANLAKNYPRLAVLVEGVGHHEFLNVRGCLPWLEAVPNLLVTTHNQFLCGGLELMVERLGAERVFFSSNQPVDDPSAGLSLLACAQISDRDRHQIAHGNIHQLIDQVGKGGYFA